MSIVPTKEDEAFSQGYLKGKEEQKILSDAFEIEVGRLKCVISGLNGQIAGDVCGMCNWLERGDCHEQKVALQNRIDNLTGSK